MKPLAVSLCLFALGCAHAPLDSPRLAPLALESTPKPLDENHFERDKPAGLSEDDLRQLLASPVFVDPEARVGVVPVTVGYQLDGDVPQAEATGALTQALQSAHVFALASEISTDWPTDAGPGGLRELGARYHAQYLLLYRARFVDQSYVNAWAWLYPTLVGAFVAPGTTVQRAGVLEATLYDVKTGTLVFTALERTRGDEKSSPPLASQNADALERRLTSEAVPKLAEQVIAKCRLLALARPAAERHAQE